MARKIIGGILILVSVALVAIEVPNGNMEPIAPAAIFIVVGLFLLIRKHISRAEKAAQKAERERHLSGTHFAGLPLAEGTPADLRFSENEIEIFCGGNTFSLPYSRINDMVFKTDAEIHEAYISSAGGAVAGGMLFGPVGAMIGGRNKVKSTSVVEHYLLITYQRDGTPDYLAFKGMYGYRHHREYRLIEESRPRWGMGKQIAL